MAMSTADDDLDPSVFLQRIRQLGEQRDQEDAARLAQLENDIIQGRSERLARRAERAKSLASPSSTPKSLTSTTAAATPTKHRDAEPTMSQSTEPISDQQPHKDEPGAAMPTPAEPTKPASPSAASISTRTGTLSWQRRPTSSGGRRPLSAVAAENNAARSPRATPDTTATSDEENVSRDKISQSLGAKDPSWFRQTADRGIGSAAYRRSQEETALDTGSMSSKRQLPGMSRESATKSEDSAGPATESASSDTPSRPGSIQESTRWSNRSSASTPVSGHSGIESRSPLPTLESQKFTPPSSDQASTDGGDRASVGRTLAMSPSQGRISPERPASPTKGAGGFVQSAILKRSDSVNKRWSAQPPGLSRQSSTTSNRSFGGLTGSMSMPRLDSTHGSLRRGNSFEPTSRPSSSHSNLSSLTITQSMDGNDDQVDNEGFVKPARPQHVRGHSVAEAYTSNTNESSDAFETSPPSPSKRWSPTKSSWLENALNKPDSPKPKAPPPQPAWMTEISKIKQQRNSVDLSRVGNLKDKPPSADHQSDTTTPGRSSSSVRRAISKTDPSPKDLPSQKEEKARSPATKSKPVAFAAKPAGQDAEKPVPKDDLEAPEANSQSTAPSPLPTEEPKPLPTKAPEPLPTTSPPVKTTPQVQPAKPKPETPPKRDFRSTLKPRQGPAESQKKEELEFQNMFGKLKRAQTEKYVAPDELKGNILRGKAGLAQTNGPQKSERRDELKDSLIKQKELMKTKAAESSPLEAKKTNDDVPAPSIPEALTKRKNLGRVDPTDNTSGAPTPAQDTTPEAVTRSSSLKDKPKPAPPAQQSQVFEQPQTKAAAGSITLAARFNPALAGVLARGPSPLAGASGSGRPPLESDSPTVAKPSSQTEEDSGASKELTHMTKGRARVPKRRAPAAKVETIDSSRAAPVKAAALVKAKDILPSSPSASLKPKAGSKPEPEAVVVTTPAKEIAKPKPITPQKSPLLTAKVSSPQDHAEQSATAQHTATPGLTPSKKLELAPLNLGAVKPEPLFSSRPLPPKANTATKRSFSPKIQISHESDPTPSVQRPPSPEPNPEKAKMSVLKAAALWGQQPASISPPLTHAKPPIKLMTKHEEADLDEKASVPQKIEAKGEPIGLGLGGFSAAATSQVEQGPVVGERKPSVNYPLSPPLRGGIAPKPAKKPASISSRPPSASLKSSPQTGSPIPHTSEAGQQFADFFDDRPVTTGKLEVDAQAILTSSAAPADKIKTLRKHIQEVAGDGKMIPVPAQEEHILFESSMYLCTHVFGSSSGIRTTEVYLWVGSSVPESTVEDAQLFCRRVAKENNGKLIILRQGKEPPNFFQALGGIVITRRGSRSDRPQKYMLCGRRHMGHVAFDEVELSLASFCSGFPYIISSQTGKHYLWKGAGCSTEELGCARLICMDLGGTSEVEEIDEGTEPAAFFDLFPPLDGKPKTIPRSAEHWRRKAKCDRYNVRLFRVEQHQQQSGFQVSNFFASIVRRPSWQNLLSPTSDRPQTPKTPETPGSTTQTKVVEIAPFAQTDLEAEHIYVLDAFFEIYIIVGALSRSQSHAFSTALLFVQEYGILAASLEDRPFVPVSTVVMEGVPRDMKAVFRRWEDRLMPTSALMAGKPRRGKSLRIVGLSAAIAATRE